MMNKKTSDDSENELRVFLEKYAYAKKSSYTSDGNTTLKDKFKELWENYISRNPFSHQSKIYLIQGNGFDSAELFWEYICEKYPNVNESKSEVKEELKDKHKGNIPSHLLELLTFLQELKNHEKALSKKEQKIYSLENEILGLKNDIRNRDNEILKKQEEIEHLHNEVVEQKALKSVIAKDEAQKVSENYQQIAHELGYGYSTFLEAKDMDMSCELGEVLRDQLSEVYEILSKHRIILGVQG